MTMLEEFISQYGTTILYAILTAIAGYLGTIAKNLYEKYVNDQTKRAVAKTVVTAVEQLYSDLDGSHKYAMAVEYLEKMLNEKGIIITELEIRLLIESAVKQFTHTFNDDKYKEVETKED